MRKWLIHGLVYLLLAGLVAGAVAYALGTKSSAVRGLVQEQLTQRFQHVSVNVEYARLRLLGGILVRELRLARNDGLDRRDFLYAPTAVIYHDKERVLDGQLLVHKVELTGPQIRIVRERDGKLNVAGVLGPIDVSAPLPAVVVRQGTVTIEDRAAGAGPVLEIRDVQLTLINDPLPTLQVEGSGQIDVLGPVRIRGTITRANFAADLTIELPDVPVNRDLIARAALLCPDLGRHASELTGRADLVATLRSDGSGPLRYDVTAKLRDGAFRHRMLPAALERIAVDVRCIDGRVPVATLKAHSGTARLDVRLAGLPAVDLDKLANPLEMGGEMDVTVTDLNVTNDVLDRLPDDLRYLKTDFSPSGPVTVRYRYRKAAPGVPLVREWVLEPKGMAGSFIEFPYPFHDVRGSVRIDASRAPIRNIAIDLSGKGGDAPVSLRGTIKGERKTGEVVLDVTGRDALLDEQIRQALPKKALDVALRFLPLDARPVGGLASRPLGKADFLVQVRRATGSDQLTKRYVVTFKNGRALYDKFPYPVENVSGVLDLQPDRWECRNFRGTHKGGEFFVEARSERLPGPTKDDRIRVRVNGKDVLLDDELAQALAPLPGLQDTWQKLRVGGRLSTTAEVVVVPDQSPDADVTVGVQGCTLRPTFFDYPLSDVSATVRYAKNRVTIKNMRARHGPAALAMDNALIVLGTDGAYTAWMEGISGAGVVPDRDLLRAVPDALRKGAEMTAFRDPFDLTMKLTVSAPPTGQGPLKFWWETGVAVKKATFRAGMEVSQADGGFFCHGHHDGRQLRGTWGDLILDRATVFNQPIKGIHGRVEVRPDTPDVIRFRDLKADFFGGSIGGEARLDLSPTFRYDVYLEALNVQLEQFGKHNLGDTNKNAQLSGPARGAIHLSGEGAELINLKGNGQVEVRQGKMGQLPVLLDLVKAFGLRVPDRTAFEQAELMFGLEGPRVIVQQLDLYGNALSLRGQGTCDLDGDNLNLDFTTSPGRLSQVLPPGLDLIPEVISQQLYKIKMRGKLGKGGGLKFEQVPVPAVVEPLRRAMRN